MRRSLIPLIFLLHMVGCAQSHSEERYFLSAGYGLELKRDGGSAFSFAAGYSRGWPLISARVTTWSEKRSTWSNPTPKETFDEYALMFGFVTVSPGERPILMACISAGPALVTGEKRGSTTRSGFLGGGQYESVRFQNRALALDGRFTYIAHPQFGVGFGIAANLNKEKNLVLPSIHIYLGRFY